MAIINKLDNTASITFNGSPVNSEMVTTNLLLPPTILKTVDKQTAGIGDTLTYTVTVTNVGLTEMTDLPFTDALPAGSSYVDDSFTENGSKVTPTNTDNTLTYTIPTIAALGTATLQFQAAVDGGTTE